MRVGIVGLGNMGRGMALRLKARNFTVSGTDSLEHVRDQRRAEGLTVHDTLPALIAESDVILLSLQTAAQVEEVVGLPHGILGHGRRGLIVIDTSTSQPEVTRRLSLALRQAGMAMIDAPVSGGPRGAEAGTMVMLLGGDAADIRRVTPMLEAISAKRVHVGPAGAGHVAKLVNNLLCATHLLSAAEAMRIIETAGLDVATVMGGINAGSGRSAVTEVNLPNWVLNGAFNSGFSMQLMRKDVNLARQMLDTLDLELPLAALAADLWAGSAATLDNGADFNRITAHPLKGDA